MAAGIYGYVQNGIREHGAENVARAAGFGFMVLGVVVFVVGIVALSGSTKFALLLLGSWIMLAGVYASLFPGRFAAALQGLG